MASEFPWTHFGDTYTPEGKKTPMRKCKHCKTATYHYNRSRALTHLSNCKEAPEEVIDQASSILAKKAAFKQAQSVVAKQRATKPTQTSIISSLNRAAAENAERAAANFIFYNNLPFGVCKSGSFQDMLSAYTVLGAQATPNQRAAAQIPIVYPTVGRLRGVLLDNADATARHSGIEAFKAHVRQGYGITIVFDGMTDGKKRPLFNVLAVCGGDVLPLALIDGSGSTKTADWIARKVAEAIHELYANMGQDFKGSVALITSDGASACVAAASLLADAAGAHAVKCACHSCNLLMEDVAKLEDINGVLVQAKTVSNWIRHHERPLAQVRARSGGAHGSTGPGPLGSQATRFASSFYLCERLLKLRPHVEFLGGEWMQNYLKGKGSAERNRANEVSNIIVARAFWASLADVVDLLRPIMLAVRYFDIDKEPNMSKAHYMLFFPYREVASFQKRRFQDNGELRVERTDSCVTEQVCATVLELILSRWQYAEDPAITGSLLFDPEFFSMDLTACGAVVLATKDLIKKSLRALRGLSQREALPSVVRFTDLDDATATTYATLCLVRKNVSVSNSVPQSALTWWQDSSSQVVAAGHFVDVALLRPVALRVLSMYPTATAAERHWSRVNFTHGLRRQSLSVERTDKLVRVAMMAPVSPSIAKNVIVGNAGSMEDGLDVDTKHYDAACMTALGVLDENGKLEFVKRMCQAAPVAVPPFDLEDDQRRELRRVALNVDELLPMEPDEEEDTGLDNESQVGDARVMASLGAGEPAGASSSASASASSRESALSALQNRDDDEPMGEVNDMSPAAASATNEEASANEDISTAKGKRTNARVPTGERTSKRRRA